MTKHGSPENRAVALPNEILRVLVGSTAHGTGEDGQEDRDEMGICVPGPEYVIGFGDFEQYIFRTQPDHVRSGPDDIDLTVYSLQKWMKLAASGNPSVLMPLFVDDDLVLKSALPGKLLRLHSDKIISKRAGQCFLGYMQAQRERLLGARGGKHTNRPELVKKYGFDTKYAMHMCRLGMQGVELLETGRFSVPMRELERNWLKTLRVGGIGKEAALIVAESYEHRIKELLDETDLPDEPDREWINDFLIEVHQWWWKG